MDVTLDGKEIEEALVQYVGGLGIDISNKEIDISMTAGRKENGYTAVISIGQSTKTTTVPVGAITRNTVSAAEVEAEIESDINDESESPTSLFN